MNEMIYDPLVKGAVVFNFNQGTVVNHAAIKSKRGVYIYIVLKNLN